MLDKVKLKEGARRSPLLFCMKKKKGHLVGIPYGLRDFRDKLFDLVSKKTKIAVEIGTAQGWFAWRCMKFLPKSAKLFCVDSFEDGPEGNGKYNKNCWKLNLEKWDGKRAFLKVEKSVSEAKKWNEGKIDFLFIDGDHTTKGLLSDLKNWLPKVQRGGLVAGHDIGGKHGANVKAALDLYMLETRTVNLKIGNIYSYTGKQITPCWWFYKEATE